MKFITNSILDVEENCNHMLHSTLRLAKIKVLSTGIIYIQLQAK